MFHLEINENAEEPAYQQIARQIRRLIMDGLLEPGSKLPSMRELAQQLGVSLTTMHSAFDVLTAENLIVARQGDGTFVTDQLSIATGANLRTRAELGGTGELPGIRWSDYAFQSEFTVIPRSAQGGDLIRFSWARPDPALYPFDRIKQAVSNMLWNPKELFFDRGHPQGYLPLVDYLEKEMALAGVPMAEGENDIIITSGFQRALSVLVRLLVRPGQKVVIEAPTYSAIVNLLLAERIDYVAVQMDEQGMDTNSLQGVLEREDVALIITIPTYHNPTGITLSPARREHLLALSAKHSVPIIEDDWGRQLRYEGPPTPPLKAQDRANNVIHIGTFSKAFLPGLRLGWITCPSDFAITIVRAKVSADQGDSFFIQALMHELIVRGHFAKHLRASVAEYRRRRDCMVEHLHHHLPEGCSFRVPDGGFTIWLNLPEQVLSLPLLTLAREAGVEFLPAAFCMSDRSDAPALRLSFSQSSIDDIEKGIPILCNVLADCLDNPSLLKRGAKSYEDLYL